MDLTTTEHPPSSRVKEQRLLTSEDPGRSGRSVMNDTILGHPDMEGPCVPHYNKASACPAVE